MASSSNDLTEIMRYLVSKKIKSDNKDKIEDYLDDLSTNDFDELKEKAKSRRDEQRKNKREEAEVKKAASAKKREASSEKKKEEAKEKKGKDKGVSGRGLSAYNMFTKHNSDAIKKKQDKYGGFIKAASAMWKKIKGTKEAKEYEELSKKALAKAAKKGTKAKREGPAKQNGFTVFRHDNKDKIAKLAEKKGKINIKVAASEWDKIKETSEGERYKKKAEKLNKENGIESKKKTKKEESDSESDEESDSDEESVTSSKSSSSKKSSKSRKSRDVSDDSDTESEDESPKTTKKLSSMSDDSDTESEDERPKRTGRRNRSRSRD